MSSLLARELLCVDLGEFGSDFFLLSHSEDEGTCVFDWSCGPGGIPSGLRKQLKEAREKQYFIKECTFGPNGEWFVRGQKNKRGDFAVWNVSSQECNDFLARHFDQSQSNSLSVCFGPDLSFVAIDGASKNYLLSDNAPPTLRDRMIHLHHDHHAGKIYNVRLFRNGGYFIHDSFGSYIENCPQVTQAIQGHPNNTVLHVTASADGAWIVILEDSFLVSPAVCRNLESKLHAFFHHGHITLQQQHQDTSFYIQRQHQRDSARERKLISDRRGIIRRKGLKPNQIVTVVGISETLGDCIINVIEPRGIVGVSRIGTHETHQIQDPRQLIVAYPEEPPTQAVVNLVKAQDKFRAAVARFPCHLCDGSFCRCVKSSLMFLTRQPSDATGSTRSITLDSLGSPMGTRDSYSEDELSVTTEEKDLLPFAPVFEDDGDFLPLDQYKCPEKIDIVRLRNVLQDLHTDRGQRKDVLGYLQSIADPTRQQQGMLDRLRRCNELEGIFEALLGLLKDYPLSNDNCVVHEVQYRHRDVSRGRLFAHGLPVRVDDSQHPRNTTLQSMKDDWKAPLAGAFGRYVEIENSQVYIICSLAKQLKLCHMIPSLLEYRQNRRKWIHTISSLHGVSEDAAKRWPNMIIGGGFNIYMGWLDVIKGKDELVDYVRKFAFNLSAEMLAFGEELSNHPRFHWVKKNRVTTLSEASMKLLTFTRIVESCENEIVNMLQNMFHHLGWATRAKIFDSLILEEETADVSLEEALKIVETNCQMQGWRIILCEQPLYGKQNDPIKTIVEARQVLQQMTL